MSTPEVVPMPQNMPPQSPMGGERKERIAKYRIPLKDGSVLIAYDDKDLMEKMQDYRANAN